MNDTNRYKNEVDSLKIKSLVFTFEGNKTSGWVIYKPLGHIWTVTVIINTEIIINNEVTAQGGTAFYAAIDLQHALTKTPFEI